MRCNDIHDRCAQLRERSARLRIKGAALRSKYDAIHDQIAAQRESKPADGSAADDAPLAPVANWPADDPHRAAMETLRVIRALIDPFPIEWQVAIVKALTARTLIKARERTQANATTTLSA